MSTTSKPALPRLISISYSPWSEKARWALDHHSVAYERQPYAPVIDELGLRWRTRKLRGTVTVPVLYTRDEWLLDSWDIARWAERVGTGAALFPAGELAAIEGINALSERGLAAGRALGLGRMLARPTSLVAMVPAKVRSALGPLAPRVAAVAVRRTLRKYRASGATPEQHRATLREVLQSIRDGLGGGATNGAPRYLLGRFSYADIAAAQVMQFVEPMNLGTFKLADEGRAGYLDPELADAFADLSAWRVQLYDTHHPRHQ